MVPGLLRTMSPPPGCPSKWLRTESDSFPWASKSLGHPSHASGQDRPPLLHPYTLCCRFCSLSRLLSEEALLVSVCWLGGWDEPWASQRLDGHQATVAHCPGLQQEPHPVCPWGRPSLGRPERPHTDDGESPRTTTKTVFQVAASHESSSQDNVEEPQKCCQALGKTLHP